MWYLWCLILNMKWSNKRRPQDYKKIISVNLFVWGMRLRLQFSCHIGGFSVIFGQWRVKNRHMFFAFKKKLLCVSQGDRYAYILQKCASEWQEPWDVVYVFSSEYQGRDLVGSHHVNTINSISPTFIIQYWIRPFASKTDCAEFPHLSH